MSIHPAGWYQDPSDASRQRYWSGTRWTASQRPHHPAPIAPFPAALPPSSAGPSGWWYFVITLLSGGVLAAVPFFHAASRLERPQLNLIGAVMAGGGVSALALGAGPGEPSDAASTLISLVLVVSATILLVGLRREVYGPAKAPEPPSANASAKARVEQARRRRTEARQLAAEDPMMARELGIGRPGAQRDYDDGGLLDLNAATATQLGDLLGLPPDVAGAVVAAREELGRFVQVEDAIVFGDVDEDHAPAVRDRGIVLGTG